MLEFLKQEVPEIFNERSITKYSICDLSYQPNIDRQQGIKLILLQLPADVALNMVTGAIDINNERYQLGQSQSGDPFGPVRHLEQGIKFLDKILESLVKFNEVKTNIGKNLGELGMPNAIISLVLANLNFVDMDETSAQIAEEPYVQEESQASSSNEGVAVVFHVVPAQGGEVTTTGAEACLDSSIGE